MTRLTALDATFLELEEADPAAHMHVGAVMIFDPPFGEAAPTLDAVAQHLQDRLGAVARFRQRLSAPHTGGLTWPTWEDDPRFDVRRHLYRAGLPAPGGRAEMEEWAATFWSQRLQRDRPLWELAVVEGLERGRWALVTKMHHCMVDGIASVDVGHLLLEGGAADVAAALLERKGEDDAGGVLGRIPGSGLAGDVTHAALHPRDTLAKARAMADVLVRDEVVPAPDCSLNERIGPRRRFAAVPVRIDDVRAVKTQLGGTINDVVLALTTASLRAVLVGRGEQPPEQGLRAMVPVNTRPAEQHGDLGNRVSSLFPYLPVAEEEPLARYARVLDETERLKASGAAVGAASLVAAIATLPPAAHATFARSLFATRLFNVTVTNIPGPRTRLSAFGGPMREAWPLVPLASEHGIGYAILSYCGRLFFGIIADHDTVPDIAVAAQAIEDEMAALLSRVAATSR